jgi:hypothetical protein
VNCQIVLYTVVILYILVTYFPLITCFFMRIILYMCRTLNIYSLLCNTVDFLLKIVNVQVCPLLAQRCPLGVRQLLTKYSGNENGFLLKMSKHREFTYHLTVRRSITMHVAFCCSCVSLLFYSLHKDFRKMFKHALPLPPYMTKIQWMSKQTVI